MSEPVDLTHFAQIKATGRLPSPRGVALAIMRMAQDETASMADLARVIEGDPAFVGRLVKVANGMLMRQRAIVSVREALMVVGAKAVRAMVLGFSLLSNYRRGNCPEFDYARFWSSSLIMAIAMQALVARLRVVAADEAFSVGLLARIGELALATVYPVKYGKLLTDAVREPGGDFAEMERQALAMTHAELGSAMLADWGFPPVFYNPVRHFEHPAQAPFAAGDRETMLMQCLILARNVAEICLGPASRRRELMAAALRLAAHLGCGREAFVADCNEVARRWSAWSRLLQFGVAEPPLSFETLLNGATDAPVAVRRAPRAEDAAAPESAPPAGAPCLRAMLIACDTEVREHLARALQRCGIKALEQAGFAGIMELILDAQPHMLVLDGGDDPLRASRFIKSLRATRIGHGMYVLLLLPDDDETHLAVFEAGADDFFVKPVGGRMLLARLTAARRIVQLQQDLEHDREELRHYANELTISNRCLQEAALTDALTTLPNRRYALEHMQQEWLAARRNQHPLACMVVDLDHFKQVNDEYGHDVGDMVLRQTASALRQILRGQDVVCRTGGDEFLVICPETSLEDALACAERLRDGIHRLAFDHDDKALAMTVSVGVALWDDTMIDIGALMKKADRAAYIAKKMGRDRVVSTTDTAVDSA
ncbi:MAG: diguanylate cyclase [Azoarcus sp.]|nr:diguanylate cyclase [Azoarcus sp.]